MGIIGVADDVHDGPRLVDARWLPAYRKRGIATAVIGRAVSHARDRGMGPMLIGALSDETAKHLYPRLGFVPRCLTRHYLLQLDAPAG